MNKLPNIQYQTRSTQLARSLRLGVTLIELLVVISILAVVSAYLIPKVRVISAERDIRETARIVGSVFNSASQRAIAEGGSGVVIVTNPNLVDNTEGGSVFYGGTALYQMRSLPPYTGDAAGQNATQTDDYMLEIPRPFEHDETAATPRYFIKVDDYIQVNNSSVSYRINTVVAKLDAMMNPVLELTLDNDGYAKPALPAGNYPFVIKRQPRILRSTRVDLPAGYMIDMRYSGPTQVFETPTAAFPAGRITPAHNVANWTNQIDDLALNGIPAESTGTAFNQELTNTIVILFRPDGGVDRIKIQPQGGAAFGTTGFGTVNPVHNLAHNGRLSGALHLLIAENDTNPINLTVQRQDSIWVTVGNDTGTVNVGINNATDGGSSADVDGFLLNATTTTRNRTQVLHAREEAGGYGALQ